MPATTVTSLWITLIVLQAIAAARLWHTGLIYRFPILTAWFGASAAFSGILLSVRLFSPSAYADAYSFACLFGVLLETGCIVEAFFALCGRFRKFSRIGGSLLLVLWMIAIASSAATRLSWVPAETVIWQVVLSGVRYADFAMVLVLAGAWILLRLPKIPIATSAMRVAGIVIGHAAYGFIVSSITISQNNLPHWWMGVLTLLGGCVTAGLAASILRTFPEEYALPPAPSREELAAKVADADEAWDVLLETRDRILRSFEK
jgi:hypothetical protein